MYKKGRLNSNSRIISTDEDPSLRIESSTIINLRGVSTNPLPADSFSKYKTKVIPNKVCIIRPYTIKYCIFRVNRLIFSRNFTSMALTISAYYLN